ncbi:nucleotidyltransferase family protein [Micromonospora sp. NPDC004704]
MLTRPADEDQLRDLVRSCDWLMRVLVTVRGSGLPDAWVGAGTIRDLVWGECYGSGFRPEQVRDLDVAYFDPGNLGREGDDHATGELRRAWPQVPWEARNQAAVHTWYSRKFGGDPVSPFRNIADAVGTWPETATSVAVRLVAAEAIEVCAPVGLSDLLAGVWRRNPRRVSLEVSRARLARHRPAQRWPAVRIIPPG